MHIIRIDVMYLIVFLDYIIISFVLNMSKYQTRLTICIKNVNMKVF